jgi:cytoskeletal protein CcmA (bactofilin family)
MSVAIAAIVLFILVLALTVLPFVPALIEWRKKTDAEPLTVVYASAVDVRHFANGFRDYIVAHLGNLLERCRDEGLTERGTLDDGTPFVTVGNGDATLLTVDETRARASHHVIASGGDLLLPERTMFLPEIYADGTVRGGEGNIYRAILAEEEIQLGHKSMCLRWLHAARSVTVLSGSSLFGRASADQFIRLERGCRFERLNAPRVEFCYQSEAGEFAGGSTYNETAVMRPRDLPNRVEVKAGRWLVSGNLDIPAGKIVKADLVATGTFTMRPGAHVVGNIKSHGDMHLERGVEVDGSVVSERDITFDPGCRIYGPVMAERSIFVGEGTIFGTATRPTTVTAENISIEPGVVAHGTVWAHVDGRVVLDTAERRRAQRENAGRKST